MEISRRQLLAGSGALLGATALESPRRAFATPRPLPRPARSGLDYVVVVMMENRSFDHYLGWLPNARGRQAGLTFTDRSGVRRATHHLTDPRVCSHPDPDHSFSGGRVQFNHGRCDGFLRSGNSDEYAIGYYTDDDLDFYGSAAPDWTVCDGYFSAIMAPTTPNRLYQHAARTDRIGNSPAVTTLPTIWDRLKAAGIRGRYYYSDVPFMALWGSTYRDISQPFTQFLDDADAGTLPAVSFIDPKFRNDASGPSTDDHPHADIRAGQYFLDQVYEAVVASPCWERTVLVVNYDEWGGFYDHVPPRVAPDAHRAWGLRGFRVPCLVVSPKARREFVAHGTYDHTSILKLIEWRWGLAPLSPRDAAARNLADVLDFSQTNLDAPSYDLAPFFGEVCGSGSTVDDEDWRALRALALSHGWSLPAAG
jgi:phospholipase C